MEPREWMIKKKEMIDKDELHSLIKESNHLEQEMLKSLDEREVYDYMISKMNYCQRKKMVSSLDVGMYLTIGDICYIDYGMAYLWETGYQHFGLILSIRNGKAFVVPVSGSMRAVSGADKRSHVMHLGMIEGMNKPSILYINDAKWINTARILDIKAHLDHKSQLFLDIKQNVREMI